MLDSARTSADIFNVQARTRYPLSAQKCHVSITAALSLAREEVLAI